MVPWRTSRRALPCLNLRVYAQDPIEARTFFAPDAEPSLDLSVPVLAINGLDNYVLPHPMNINFTPYDASSNATAYTASGSGPRGNFIGRDFRAAYAPGVTLNGAGQTLGLFELDGYFPNDVAQYESLAGLPERAAYQSCWWIMSSGNAGIRQHRLVALGY